MGRTNIVSKHQIYTVEMTSVLGMQNELRLHGPIHIFSIWDTDRVLDNCQHPSNFGTLAIFALQCSFIS